MIFTNNLLPNIQPIDVFQGANPAVQVTNAASPGGFYNGLQAMQGMQNQQLAQQRFAFQQEQAVQQQQRAKQATLQNNIKLMQGFTDQMTGIEVNNRDLEAFDALKQEYGITTESIQKASIDLDAMEKFSGNTASFMQDSRVKRMVQDKARYDAFSKQYNELAERGMIGENEQLEYTQILADYNSGASSARLIDLDPNKYIDFKQRQAETQLAQAEVAAQTTQANAIATNAATNAAEQQVDAQFRERDTAIKEKLAQSDAIKANNNIPDAQDNLMQQAIQAKINADGSISDADVKDIMKSFVKGGFIENKNVANTESEARAYTFRQLVASGVDPIKALDQVERTKLSGKQEKSGTANNPRSTNGKVVDTKEEAKKERENNKKVTGNWFIEQARPNDSKLQFLGR